VNGTPEKKSKGDGWKKEWISCPLWENQGSTQDSKHKGSKGSEEHDTEASTPKGHVYATAYAITKENIWASPERKREGQKVHTA